MATLRRREGFVAAPPAQRADPIDQHGPSEGRLPSAHRALPGDGRAPGCVAPAGLAAASVDPLSHTYTSPEQVGSRRPGPIFLELDGGLMHDVEFEVDEFGWDYARCTCGWVSPPCPEKAIAADFYGDHRAEVSE